ncbi:hypothetical protein EVAR_33312_1 [Eumeta japonica]|uniref:Uncharacterized protein n=1 Tax=Eumeta variegata TaxID=151549 RepID=A0A4C1WE93_EUMVA|nr:hypothetical protein EVAR_33312_1 [Eumeta japonica]
MHVYLHSSTLQLLFRLLRERARGRERVSLLRGNVYCVSTDLGPAEKRAGRGQVTVKPVIICVFSPKAPARNGGGGPAPAAAINERQEAPPYMIANRDTDLDSNLSYHLAASAMIRRECCPRVGDYGNNQSALTHRPFTLSQCGLITPGPSSSAGNKTVD